MTVKWEDWQATRARKRELLRRYGVDAPSRRSTAFGSSELRLRAAFGGARVPAFTTGKEKTA